MKKDLLRKTIVYAIGVVLFLCGCIMLRGRYEFDLTTEEKIISYINQYYLYEYDEETFKNKNYMDIVKSLGDKYTGILPYDDTKELDPSNLYIYIGAFLCYEENMNYPVFCDVIEKQNAYKSGIKNGDELIAIDGISTSTMSAKEIYNAFCGKLGTCVEIEVRSQDAVSKYTVERQKRSEEVVTWKMLNENVGYIKISKFDGNMCIRFKEALLDLEKKNYNKLILDLRSNPGGENGKLEWLADRFVRHNELIYFMVDKYNHKECYYTEDDDEISCPLVVLIDEKTASCSEILALFLREKKNAKIIGKTSVGKGVSQTIIPINEGELRITSSYWYSPSGCSINKIGIIPDIEIEDIPETEDDEVVGMALDSF